MLCRQAPRASSGRSPGKVLEVGASCGYPGKLGSLAGLDGPLAVGSGSCAGEALGNFLGVVFATGSFSMLGPPA